MPKKTFTEEQVIAALKKAESGVSVADVCRQTGVTEMTFYRIAPPQPDFLTETTYNS